MDSGEPTELSAAVGPAYSRIRRRFLVVAVAAIVTLVALVLVIRKPRLPRVTSARLAEARRQWAAAGIQDYDVRVEVRGRQAAEYEVEVRGGEVQRAHRNGQPLKGWRTMGTWSVPGMFTTIELDLVHQEAADAGRATADTPLVELRAEFDPQLGVPRRCQRIQFGGPGANPEVFWEVKSFVVSPP